MSDTTIRKTEGQQIFGHPKGLFILFFTEMWERFSFYGMKALLIFYLTKYHLFTDIDGNLLIGSYAALVYAIPVVGGFLADRYLGFRKAIVFGGIMLVLGHAGMAYEGNAATQSVTGEIVRDNFALQVFYLSLAFIILGVGFLKANISSLVGELYHEGDKRRDSGFTIFYMGINLGSFLATIICVWLGETYGWSYGFGAAGVGMFFGLLTFILGKKHLLGKGESNVPELLNKKTLGIKNEWLIYGLSVLATLVVWQMVQSHSVVQSLLIIAGAASFIYIVYYAITQLDKVARERLIALTILIVFTVIFWALFEQAYTSLNLFADRILDRGEIAAGTFLSLNALFIIILAPVFAWLWVKLGKYNPNTAVKFSLALMLVGLGFGSLVMGINASEMGKVAIFWLVITYFLHTCGELCLSPVGLSAVTKLSPVKIVGFMMGVWFLATASSEFIASILANIASVDTTNGVAPDLNLAKQSYLKLFEYLFYTGLGFGALLLMLSPIIKKLMHGVDKELNN
ncbi:Di-/tripeptide transporter [Mariniflexile rhizosphaerae]|uniref:peptide MFS transporter n=1 Tax=unclassified Mariniflexile TaxID=2643887 RepID=UPI000CA90E95|nr:peptide MFS transporter [Mariniflexile sp. TRM1-10]AXP81361.1 Di-/tripeptide transporter [Mariniflexile sp. TRM1-10]PLB18539.1 MAG: Proton-dependent di-tripeptide transporter [Flavobacteriaceae bacterium FS1-H7996/R]